MNTEAPRLVVEGLRKSFGALVVVDDVSFVLAPGRVLGVMGPNGAGKTTLISVVSGSLPADSGRVELAGRDVSRRGAVGRCRLGLARTHQVPRSFENMTVFENVLVGSTNGAASRVRGRKERYELAAQALSETGLLAKANRLAGSLPLLDRKRLELSRALGTSPDVLLLDEIAGGLTEAEMEELVALIVKIRDRGLSVVWIEHVVHALVAVVDELLALNYGRVIVQGAPEVVMANRELEDAYLGKVAP